MNGNSGTKTVERGASVITQSATLDESGGVVAFLCTDEAKWINGQRIEVASGMML